MISIAQIAQISVPAGRNESGIGVSGIILNSNLEYPPAYSEVYFARAGRIPKQKNWGTLITADERREMKLPAVPKAFGTGYLLGKVKIIILSSFISIVKFTPIHRGNGVFRRHSNKGENNQTYILATKLHEV